MEKIDDCNLLRNFDGEQSNMKAACVKVSVKDQSVPDDSVKLESIKYEEKALDFNSQLKLLNGDEFTAKKRHNRNVSSEEEDRKITNVNMYKTGKPKKVFECDVCQRNFAKMAQLILHMRSHTGERPFKCSQCPAAYANKIILDRHVKIHSGIRPYECDVCGKTFVYKINLKKHYLTHTGERPYQCDICAKTYTQRAHLKRHKYNVHNHKPSVGRESKKKTERRPKRNLVNLEGNRHQCDVCGMTFLLPVTLRNHKKTHSNERAYQCDICFKRFKLHSTLLSHKKTHNEHKDHKCEYCFKEFTHKYELNMHKRIHTGERPYQCTTCAKTFRQAPHLKVHERTHSGLKPYECDICSKCFLTAGAMREHKEIHKENRCYECETCQRKFTTLRNFKSHRREHNPITTNTENLINRFTNVTEKQSDFEGNASTDKDLINDRTKSVDNQRQLKYFEAFKNEDNLSTSEIHKKHNEYLVDKTCPDYLRELENKNYNDPPDFKIEDNQRTNYVKDEKVFSDSNSDDIPHKIKYSFQESNRKKYGSTDQPYETENFFSPDLKIEYDQTTNYVKDEIVSSDSNSDDIPLNIKYSFQESKRKNQSDQRYDTEKKFSPDLHDNFLIVVGNLKEDEQININYNDEVRCNDDVLSKYENRSNVDLFKNESEKNYKCHICGKGFVLFASLQSHGRLLHGNEFTANKQNKRNNSSKKKDRKLTNVNKTEKEVFQCDVCQRKFATMARLIPHKRLHTGDRPFKCSQCPAAYANKLILKRHVQIHSGIRPHECNVCGKTFVYKINLKKHNVTHTGERRYQCDICAKTYTQGAHLKRHKDNVHKKAHLKSHKDNVHNKPKDGRERKKNTERRPPRKLVNLEGNQHQCNMCGLTFLLPVTLRNHEKTHSNERPYQCNICFKHFKLNSGLLAHKMTHNEHKDHKCEYCFKEFTHKYELNIHKRIHTGERPYKCTTCAKTFRQTTHLKVHERTHSGLKPFECDICSKCFITAGAMREHKEIHKENRCYECETCQKKFTTIKNFKRHTREHNPITT